MEEHEYVPRGLVIDLCGWVGMEDAMRRWNFSCSFAFPLLASCLHGQKLIDELKHSEVTAAQA